MSDEEPESTLYVKYPDKLVILLEKVRQEHPHIFAPIEKCQGRSESFPLGRSKRDHLFVSVAGCSWRLGDGWSGALRRPLGRRV